MSTTSAGHDCRHRQHDCLHPLRVILAAAVALSATVFETGLPVVVHACAVAAAPGEAAAAAGWLRVADDPDGGLDEAAFAVPAAPAGSAGVAAWLDVFVPAAGRGLRLAAERPAG